MKILIVRPFPSLLDVRQNTYNIQEIGLAKALNRRGCQTDLLFWTDGEEAEITIPVEGGASVRVFYRKAFSKLKNAWYPKFDAMAEQYDVIQTAEYNQMFSWHLAGKYPQKTIIYHGPYACSFNKNYNRMCRVFDLLFLNRYRKKRTPFLVKSELARQFLLGKGIRDEDISVAGVGIDIQALETGKDAEPSEAENRMAAQTDGLKLLYIGRIEPRRDPFFVLDILENVRKTDAQAKLYIIGDGETEYVAQVRQAIREKGLEDCIFWQKKTRQPQLKGVYQQADFFLLPTEYEIFGMVLLEAMYFGALVLTTPNGGANMLVRDGENGFVLPKDDARKWARCMLELRGSSERRTQMQIQAHECIAQDFTWDKLAEGFLVRYAMLNRR